ncbi:hypothetical protein BD626DRAFT_491497 [Schizophyllum amplum]|uniref:Arrestin-like N-terminal domain-containing protein n=1 Tax=Schizophyllum amplum TaxID=97359 RepID=A0A550CHQ9_9AGAR|nr:hypothetical protein BD626DRAFT_491497 [Auriculariopsis ampla]
MSRRHSLAPVSLAASQQPSAMFFLPSLVDEELPCYSRRDNLPSPSTPRTPTEHTYTLGDGKRPWLSLTMVSNARAGAVVPQYHEKEHVRGTVHLRADKRDSIQAVNLLIKGRVITGASAGDSFTFLNLNAPLWSRSGGVHSENVPEGDAWQFSIPLPINTTVHMGDGSERTFALPGTFLEKDAPVSVKYDFVVIAARGKLRSDGQINATFGYAPSSRPLPPSIYRQIAYQQGTHIPSPLADPEGWHTRRDVLVRGTLFCARQVELTCQLSLARPLTYTRGSVLPLYLTMAGPDLECVDLLGAPQAIVVVLQRRIAYRTAGQREQRDEVGRAVWWPAQPPSPDCLTRDLEGEIHLTKDLKPSCNVPSFVLSYHVVMYPFEATGFKPGPPTTSDGHVARELVDIATMHPKGPIPRPIAYTPPAYETPKRRNRSLSFAVASVVPTL